MIPTKIINCNKKIQNLMCDESNLVILLKLMSNISRSRKFLNWFFFIWLILFPCKSSVFNFLKTYKMQTIKNIAIINLVNIHTWNDSIGKSAMLPLVKWIFSNFSEAALSTNISGSSFDMLCRSILSTVKWLRG